MTEKEPVMTGDDRYDQTGETSDLIVRYAYSVMIVVSLAMILGRLFNTVYLVEPWVRNWPDKSPTTFSTLSSNDRSRWATVRAIVDNGTYSVGQRMITENGDGDYEDSGIRFETGLRGVDYVLHPDRNKFYSSKPPLLATIIAVPYWLLQRVTGWTLADNLLEVTRSLLVVINVLPWAVYLWLVSRIVDQHAERMWTRLFVFATASMGTLLTTFTVTLNNHLPAAVCAMAVIYLLFRVLQTEQAQWRIWALIGALCGFILVCELPGAALVGVVFLWLSYRCWRMTCIGFLPGVILIIGLMFLTNFMALGRWEPVYRFRHFEDPDKADYIWYHYEGSHWSPEKIAGIDAAQESKSIYAFHVLLGHHGILSHSPVFLLSVIGIVLGWKKGGEMRLFSLLTAIVSSVVIGFYVLNTNNYGGNTSGFRWSFWLIPLWIVVLIPAVDMMSKCVKGRLCSLLLLAVSVISVSFPIWNPWRPNWPYRLLDHLEWIDYSIQPPCEPLEGLNSIVAVHREQPGITLMEQQGLPDRKTDCNKIKRKEVNGDRSCISFASSWNQL